MSSEIFQTIDLSGAFSNWVLNPQTLEKFLAHSKYTLNISDWLNEWWIKHQTLKETSSLFNYQYSIKETYSKLLKFSKDVYLYSW